MQIFGNGSYLTARLFTQVTHYSHTPSVRQLENRPVYMILTGLSCALGDECHGLGYKVTKLLHSAAGLGSLKLEYDANKNPSIFQQLCALQLNTVIQQASNLTQLMCRPWLVTS